MRRGRHGALHHFSLTGQKCGDSFISRLGYLDARTRADSPGTLDLLILKAVSLGPLYGYGILLRIEQISHGALLIEQGALYPALFRLVRQGLLKAHWDTSENNRRTKFYELTTAGRKRLRQEEDGWNRLVAAITSALKAQPEET